MPKIKKSTTEKVSAPVKEKKEQYRFEVLVNDSHFKTTVDSLAEGIDEFIKSPDFPIAIKTKVILRFGKGDELIQKLWPTAIARRIFASMDVKPALIDFFGEQLTRRL
jgi:hypothetical protein